MSLQLNTEIFDHFPEINTRRLLLRSITIDDAMHIFKMRSNNRMNEFIARPAMDNPDSAVQLVEKVKTVYNNRQGIGWAGQIKGDPSIIGTCGFNTFDYDNLRLEIGGEMDVAFWGKRLAEEAVKAILQIGLNEINAQAIEAKVFADNRSAIYLMEHFGFVKEAHFKNRIYFNGQFIDMAVYTLHKGKEKF